MAKKKKKAPAKKKKPAPKKKKPAPKKKKAAAPKKKAAPKAAAPKPVAAKPAGEKWTTFPAVLVELNDWVNGGRAGEIDFEMYESFNEQYKPSDWTRNPATDDELFTFAMDGTGGQVAIWRRDPGGSHDDQPIVFMGSEGEVKPLAMSLPGFLFLIASGLGPLEITSGGEPAENEEMMAWVKESYPDVATDTTAILDEAAKKLADFEAHLMAQVPKD